MRVGGVDPGVKGGVAVIDTDHLTLRCAPMPLEKVGAKERKLASAGGLVQLFRAHELDALFLEEVGVRPGEGTVGAFSFGRGLGRIEGAAAGRGLPLYLVKPQLWKSKLGVSAEKERCVAKAEALFPCARHLFRGPRGGLNDGPAEACLIALYGVLTAGIVLTKPLVLLE